MALETYALTTVALVKTYLGISVTTYDTLIEDLINGCTDWFEHECGGRRFFSSADVTEYYDGGEIGAYPGEASRHKTRIFTKKYPIISITSLSYNSSGNYSSPTWTAFSATTEYIRKDESGEIYFPGSLPLGFQNIQLIYKGGYATIPHDLEIGCRKMVAKEFSKRKAQGATNESIAGGSIDWNEDLDPSITRLVNYYKAYHV